MLTRMKFVKSVVFLSLGLFLIGCSGSTPMITHVFDNQSSKEYTIKGAEGQADITLSARKCIEVQRPVVKDSPNNYHVITFKSGKMNRDSKPVEDPKCPQ